MNNSLADFVSDLQDHDRDDGAFELLFAFAQRIGFDDLNFMVADYENKVPYGIFSTMEKDWLAHYHQSNYGSADSLLNHALNHEGSGVVDIDDCKALACSDAKLNAQMCDEMRDGRRFSNFFHSTRSPALGCTLAYNFVSSLSGDELVRATRDNIDTLKTAIGLSQLAVLDDLQRGHFGGILVPLSNIAALTPREREVLRWLSQGYRVDRIAERLKLSTATVNFHINSAKKRLGARTREQAVAMMIRARQI